LTCRVKEDLFNLFEKYSKENDIRQDLSSNSTFVEIEATNRSYKDFSYYLSRHPADTTEGLSAKRRKVTKFARSAWKIAWKMLSWK
jgi:HEPN domain-containing protein